MCQAPFGIPNGNLTFNKKYDIIKKMTFLPTGNLTKLKNYDIIIMEENNNKPTGAHFPGRPYLGCGAIWGSLSGKTWAI